MSDALLLHRALRLLLWFSRVERPLTRRDRSGWYLFALAFAVYWLIGEFVAEFHGHDVYDSFFNADCPRVLADMTRAQHGPPTLSFFAAAGHPLFVLITNPIAASLSRLLDRSESLAALLVCHAACALSVTLFHSILKRLELARGVAWCFSLVYLLSTSHLVFGSLVETFSFVPLALMLSVWLPLRGASVLANALSGLFAFGVIVVLAPYALLAPLLAWSQRLSFARFFARVGSYWATLGLLAALAFYAQQRLYPHVNPFDTSSQHAYDGYIEIPKSVRALSQRGRRLLAHVFLYNVIAPKPILHEPRDLTTFMWNEGEPAPRFARVGVPLAFVWIGAVLVASYRNIRRLLVLGRDTRAVVLLSGGWLVGTSGVFLCFGDDLLLFSTIWTAHLLLWVAIGLAADVHWTPKRCKWLLCAGVFVALLAANNANFVRLMLRNYSNKPLITL